MAKNIPSQGGMIIIFDLDGTLLNTIDDLGYACNHAHVPFVACSWGFVPRETLVEKGVKHIVDTPEEIMEETIVPRAEGHGRWYPYHERVAVEAGRRFV